MKDGEFKSQNQYFIMQKYYFLHIVLLLQNIYINNEIYIHVYMYTYNNKPPSNSEKEKEKVREKKKAPKWKCFKAETPI